MIKNRNYILGAILEVIGFALLFAFDTTMSYINQYPQIFAILLIVIGYFMAIGSKR